jgi:hypothetical protein
VVHSKRNGKAPFQEWQLDFLEYKGIFAWKRKRKLKPSVHAAFQFLEE